MNRTVLATLILVLVPPPLVAAMAGDGSAPVRRAVAAETVAARRAPGAMPGTHAKGRDVNKPIKGEYLPRSIFTRSLRQRGPDLSPQEERQAIADGWR